jgi:uncharacterized protein (UPF0548 family)
MHDKSVTKRTTLGRVGSGEQCFKHAPAALEYDGSKVGWRWCIHNHHGSFIVAGSNFIHQRLSNIEGEATSIKEAICEAIQQGFFHVTFESD